MNKETKYEKDLSEMKEQILKEGNTLLTKRDLLERFCEIDKEYEGHPWNLLQILANINILIGEEPCYNLDEWCHDCSEYDQSKHYCPRFNRIIRNTVKEIKKSKTGHWIEIGQYSDGKHKIECSECKNYIVDRGHANSFNVKNKYKYCPNCGSCMVESQTESEK